MENFFAMGRAGRNVILNISLKHRKNWSKLCTPSKQDCLENLTCNICLMQQMTLNYWLECFQQKVKYQSKREKETRAARLLKTFSYFSLPIIN